MKQATANLKFLEAKLRNKSNAAQYHNMANRLLGDLEFRGHVRPITEEFNLAANFLEEDVCNAEFYRTFPSATFQGAALLRRLRAEKQALDSSKQLQRLTRPVGSRQSSDKFHISLEDAYGYRGNTPCI